ncbi:MAG: epoxide hydrolase [Propionibacteriaceae bacterium]|nr:epoxide hydrolase [Propionibacteriaceae bacterium]
MHFVYQRSQTSGAPTVVVLHGWPYTFVELLPLADALQEADVVVPSLPGFGFSTIPQGYVATSQAIADTVHRLVTEELGVERYLVYGEDVGAPVSRQLGRLAGGTRCMDGGEVPRLERLPRRRGEPVRQGCAADNCDLVLADRHIRIVVAAPPVRHRRACRAGHRGAGNGLGAASRVEVSALVCRARVQRSPPVFRDASGRSLCGGGGAAAGRG